MESQLGPGQSELRGRGFQLLPPLCHPAPRVILSLRLNADEVNVGRSFSRTFRL